MIKKLTAFLKQAFNSEHQDFTSLPINKAIVLLAIPMMLEMVMESVFAVVDTYFVTKLGTDAMATIGFTESMLTIVYSLGIGISMAGTAIVARRVGEKNHNTAAKAGAQTILLGVCVSIVIGIVGIVFSENLLRAMGAKEDTISYGKLYTQIMLGTNVVIMLLFIINGIFRGIGNANTAFKSLLIANCCNIIFCPLFIVVFNWGLTGAALATLCGRGIGVVYQITQLNKTSNLVKIEPTFYRYDKIQVKAILDIAVTATLQFVIASGSWIALNRIISSYGKEASAGYTLAIRLLLFFIMPAWGISNAAATLVGQNLGAGKPDRAEKAVWRTAIINAAFMFFVTALFFIFGKAIVGLFGVTEPKVAATAVEALRIITLGYVTYGIGMVLLNSYNGAGDSKTPTYINLVGYWLFQIPFAYFMAYYLNLKTEGVYYSIIITETIVMLISLYFFRKGKWKLKQV